MASFILPKPKFLSFTLICVAVCCCYSGYAEENPGQAFVTALACFHNKFIYAGCDEAYRLNESGTINVAPGAADLFCHGPCFAETQQVLNCVDNMLSSFIFNNRATLPDIRGALRAGCSYNSQRGNFFGFGPFGQYRQGETSSAQKLSYFISFFTFFTVIGCFLFILH